MLNACRLSFIFSWKTQPNWNTPKNETRKEKSYSARTTNKKGEWSFLLFLRQQLIRKNYFRNELYLFFTLTRTGSRPHLENGSVADQLRYRDNTISPTKRFAPIGAGDVQLLQPTSMLNTSVKDDIRDFMYLNFFLEQKLSKRKSKYSMNTFNCNLYCMICSTKRWWNDTSYLSFNLKLGHKKTQLKYRCR